MFLIYCDVLNGTYSKDKTACVATSAITKGVRTFKTLSALITRYPIAVEEYVLEFSCIVT